MQNIIAVNKRLVHGLFSVFVIATFYVSGLCVSVAHAQMSPVIIDDPIPIIFDGSMMLDPAVSISLISPAPGPDTVLSKQQVFTWNAVTNATEYAYSLGNTVGGSNLSSGSTGAATTVNIPAGAVPQDGRTVYLRIKYKVGGVWNYNDFFYKTSLATVSPPVISTITQTPVFTGTTFIGYRISWVTDIPADSTVEYGLTTSYGSTVSDPTAITAHQVNLTGLVQRTVYHYRVRSKDPVSGAEGISADQSFSTDLMSIYKLGSPNRRQSPMPPPTMQSLVQTEPIPISNPLLAKFSSLFCLVKGALGVMLDIGAIIATLFILYAGLLFLTAGGSEDKLKTAKATLLWSVIGLAVLLASWVLAGAIKDTFGTTGGAGTPEVCA